MLLQFWEGLLWSDVASFMMFIKGLSGSHLHFPVLVIHGRKQWGWGSIFLTAVWRGQDSQQICCCYPCLCALITAAALLQLTHTHREERASGKAEGSTNPASVSCLPLMKWPETIPMLSKRLKKVDVILQIPDPSTTAPSGCHSRLHSLNLCFDTFFQGFLLCSVSEFQQVKDNKILSLAQLVINSTKKVILALPLIASFKGSVKLWWSLACPSSST